MALREADVGLFGLRKLLKRGRVAWVVFGIRGKILNVVRVT